MFTRTARGTQLTVDGQAFLPHARELVRVADRAEASVRPGRRALRVDVVNRRVAPAVLLQDFYRGHPEIELGVVTLDAEPSDLGTLAGESSRYLGRTAMACGAFPCGTRHPSTLCR